MKTRRKKTVRRRATKRVRKAAERVPVQVNRYDGPLAWGSLNVPASIGMANCCFMPRLTPTPPIVPTRETELKDTIKRLVDLI